MSKADRFPEIKSQAQIDWECAGSWGKVTILLGNAFQRAGVHPVVDHVRRTFSILGLS
jgi:hypothetical protein